MSITLPVLDSARKSQTMLVTVTTSMELLWLVLGRRGWDVQFDIFPLENHTIKSIDRKKLITVPSDEEEKEYDIPFDNQSLP
jgi:hypothetical protein